MRIRPSVITITTTIFGLMPIFWATGYGADVMRAWPSLDGKPVRAYYFLEADRGTMPVQRQNLSQSSFHRKLLAYEATWTQNLHRTRLGLHRFRVLTVTTTPDRVKTLVAACRQLQRGQGLFLFIDLDAFRACSSPLNLPWESAREDAHEPLVESLFPADFPRQA